MKALPALLVLVPALSSCGGADEPACTANDPVRQERIHHVDEATAGQYSTTFPYAGYELAVRLDAAMLRPVECGYLGGVRLHWWPPGASAVSVKVYGAGTATAPGALLHQQAVPGLLEMDWTVVTLDPPLDLPPGDLWIALEVTLPGPGWVSIGMDAGPRKAGANFTRLDGTWAELEADRNFAIEALAYH